MFQWMSLSGLACGHPRECRERWSTAKLECHLLFPHPLRNTLQTHYILDEMCVNGCIVETNKNNALAPIHLLEKAT